MGDPFFDYDRYDAMMASIEARTPICDNCHEHCTEEDFFKLDDDTILCPECMDDWVHNHKYSVADYLSDN